MKHLLSELHTNSVRVGIPPAPKIFQNANEINLLECMWSNVVVSQAYPGWPSCFLAFLHLRQPVTSREKGLWVE